MRWNVKNVVLKSKQIYSQKEEMFALNVPKKENNFGMLKIEKNKKNIVINIKLIILKKLKLILKFTENFIGKKIKKFLKLVIKEDGKKIEKDILLLKKSGIFQNLILIRKASLKSTRFIWQVMFQSSNGMFWPPIQMVILYVNVVVRKILDFFHLTILKIMERKKEKSLVKLDMVFMPTLENEDSLKTDTKYYVITVILQKETIMKFALTN